MSFHFAPLDYAIVGFYFAVLIAIGIATARRDRSQTANASEEFLVGGRRLTLPAFVATLVATWYGGILGVGESAYTVGIATWSIFGLPYYLWAVLYALFLAHRVRGTDGLTIPDLLQRAHGKPVALLGALWLFFLVTPAPYTLMLGTLLHDLFGGNTLISLIIGMGLSVAFVVTGGMNTDIRTNIFQFLLMFAAFIVLLGFAFARSGIGVLQAIPHPLLTLGGGKPTSYLLVWYAIALWTLVDPGFHQRCSAARDAKTARNGILISVLCWAFFDFLTVTTGLYARALLPNLAEAVNAYPALAEKMLPPGWLGFFWVGMLATVMSTVLSYTFIAAITLGRDIIWRLREANDENRENDVRWTQFGVVVTSLLSVLFAYLLPSVIGLWYTLGTAFVPGLLLPLLSAYIVRLRVAPGFVFAASLVGTLLPIFWMLLGLRNGGLETPYYPWQIEPMWMGLGGSSLIWSVGLVGRNTRSRM